ncbi:serine hydrolase domain-containing protein [Winogradskyella sp. PG-2]|uniref:serine hydrolase domain-containing protein n=1 Tax=Winogradskyella sp. PG-2 TaxID=754409 RepID=UPI00045868C1|nr:serine hydrolase domain-containing protein [Winogradskyella sp. PG-2]BAO75755.1 D-alanyl-D-alanine carboxypeptidase [Winogradskyella sp. PG-2]
MKKTITLLAFLISVSSLSQNDIKKIDSIVNSKIAENDPGLMVGIVKDGKIIYEKYRGLAYLQFQIKIDKKTKSNIASTAKQYTALMILDLVLNKKLDLEDDIRKYLPSLYKKVKDQIKIRHVLNHTSGIRDYCDLMGLQNDIWWKKIGLKNDDVINLLKQQEDLAFKPGSEYTYSNSGYVVLAEIIEKISGKKFTNYSKQFFSDLGMKETLFIERYAGIIPNRAEPYGDWGDGIMLQTPTVTKTAGEGFLYTTLKDQLHFEQAVQNANQNSNTLLIKSQQPIPNSEITTYGFGLELNDFLNRKAVHHSGATGGYNSQMIRFPEEKLTIFAMSNNGNISTYMIANEIANVLLPKINKKEQYNPRLSETIGTSEKVQITGQYHTKSGYLTRIVTEEDKTYFKQGRNLSIELIPETKNKYHLDYDPKSKLVFYKEEMVLFEPSGKMSIYKRSNEKPASFADLEGFIGTYFSDELDMSFSLSLDKNNKLKMNFSNRNNERDAEVFNKNELLSRNFTLKINRDQFDRVTEIFLSLGRAKNNRFKKMTNLTHQPKVKTENGSIQVTTIGSVNGNTSDILLTKNHQNGNEVWSQKFGGNSYDKASSILSTDDGYLIIGSTSSYGKGNYDMFVIKTDKKGNKIWQNTFGDFYNEYGYSAEKTVTGFLIKGTIQNCTSNTDVFNRECTTNVWFVSIDKNGKELSNKILEEIK